MNIDDFKLQFKKLPLGLRLNNPGCLRVSSAQWNGKIGSKNGFCQFMDFKFGIRALSLVLCKYFFTYHLFDLKDILLRYAPQSDGNKPCVYYDFVRQKLGFSTFSINIPTLGLQLPLLVYYITCMELGKEYEIKSKEFKGFTSYFFGVVDATFDEYLNNVFYPVYGKVPNICV